MLIEQYKKIPGGDILRAMRGNLPGSGLRGLDLEPPAPESGITVDDIRDAVRRLREALERFPELAFMLEDVPDIYDPEKEAKNTPGRSRVITLGPRVPRADKYKALDAIETLYNESAGRLNEKLVEGSIGVDSWLEAMRKEVSAGHVSAYVAGRSGAWSSISFSEWGRTGARIKRQFQFLKGFADEIRRKGVDAFSLDYLNNRTGLYGSNMRESLEAGNLQDRGVDPSILPAMPGDGTTKCLVRCKCRWTVRGAGRDRYLISWRLGSAEHCRTCLDRAHPSTGWVNLEIVNGRLISQVTPYFYNHN